MSWMGLITASFSSVKPMVNWVLALLPSDEVASTVIWWPVAVS